jgi:hypothetical protein
MRSHMLFQEPSSVGSVAKGWILMRARISMSQGESGGSAVAVRVGRMEADSRLRCEDTACHGAV